MYLLPVATLLNKNWPNIRCTDECAHTLVSRLLRVGNSNISVQNCAKNATTKSQTHFFKNLHLGILSIQTLHLNLKQIIKCIFQPFSLNLGAKKWLNFQIISQKFEFWILEKLPKTRENNGFGFKTPFKRWKRSLEVFYSCRNLKNQIFQIDFVWVQYSATRTVRSAKNGVCACSCRLQCIRATLQASLFTNGHILFVHCEVNSRSRTCTRV